MFWLPNLCSDFLAHPGSDGEYKIQLHGYPSVVFSSLPSFDIPKHNPKHNTQNPRRKKMKERTFGGRLEGGSFS